MLGYVFDEREFLLPYGIRSLALLPARRGAAAVHHYYAAGPTVDVPIGSGQRMNLADAARGFPALVSLFLPDAAGRPRCHSDERRFAT